MKKYNLKYYPDPMLRKICLPVTEVNSSIIHMINKMTKIMYSHKGIGLAASQIGSLDCVIIADIGEGLISMINPEILTGFGEDYLEEGCLSLPETRVNVKRQESIFVRYLDKNEREKETEMDGLTARVIQHEIDHLNGVLIIDYATVSDRISLLSDLKM